MPDAAPAFISVVVPCFNAAPFLAGALRSVLDQEGVAGLEVIVVDDGSSDESVAIARGFGAPVLVLEQANAGPAAARNRGIAAARGALVAFLDADDVWLPGKLASQLALLEQAPDAGVVYGDFYFWRPPQGRELVTHPPHTDAAVRSGRLYPQILLDSLVCMITAVVRREVFERIGGFDEQLRTGEDYDFWIRAALHTRCLKVAQPVALYRLHEGGTTRVPRSVSNEYEVVRRAAALHGVADAAGRVLPRERLNERLYRLAFDHAYLHYWRGDARVARRHFARAIGHAPRHLKAWGYWLLALLRPRRRG